MSKQIDLTGRRFGRLVALKVSTRPKSFTTHYWHCICDCGNAVEVMSSSLRNGDTSSCGCYQRDQSSVQRSKYTAVGLHSHPVRHAWTGMIKRCTDPKNEAYRHYGGRGISVCERWHRFENFLEDMGDRPEGMSIERIDVNGNYEPGNCKWATPTEQARNTRRTRYVEVSGERMPITECAERFGISIATLRWRLYRAKWTIEQALELEPHPDMRQQAVGLGEGDVPWRSNKSGYVGVTKNGKNWRAKISVNGKEIGLGTYGTPEEANQAIVKAKQELLAAKDKA